MRILGLLCVTQFSMVLFFLGLLLMFPLGLVLTDGSFVSHWSGCGRDRFFCLESSDGCHFFINGRMVDHVLFCTFMEFQVASGCLSCPLPQEDMWRRFGESSCTQDFSESCRVESNSLTAITFPLGLDLPPTSGRKLLMQLSANSSISNAPNDKVQSQEENNRDLFSFTPEKMALAVPVMFFLCCVLLCPCFQAKRKEESKHVILGKDLSSMDSVSSSEVIFNTTPERILVSPLRVPPSTYRVPTTSRLSLSPQLSRVGPLHLSLGQIIKATQNFSPTLLIGGGGFGTVYKAELPSGQVVAIKRARKEHFAALQSEFFNEVELLAKIEHRNLVKLLGYVDKENERIIISEYVPNGTLREHLDGRHGKILDFNQRLEIAIDVAHALTYLHVYAEKPIIHRDVKSSNILLTESMRAKVADFGFARAVPTDSEQTHICTMVRGTAGYLDPEYLQTYQLTPKSDVFSFGILLIEILSGRRPVEINRAVDERITIRWAFQKYSKNDIGKIMDPLLEKVVDEEILSKLFDLAFQSAAPTRSDRPSMKEVVEQLWAIRKDYARTLGRY